MGKKRLQDEYDAALKEVDQLADDALAKVHTVVVEIKADADKVGAAVEANVTKHDGVKKKS